MRKKRKNQGISTIISLSGCGRSLMLAGIFATIVVDDCPSRVREIV